MEFRVSNYEADAEVKERCRKIILIDVCRKYRETGDPTFNYDELEKRIRGYDPKFLGLNIRENWARAEFVDIDDNYNFYLNEEGKKACKRGEFDRF
jgi:hypothetical protein